jgi:hypothetical protein
LNDPHVVSLTYRLEMGKGLTFNNPPRSEHETDHFTVSLENGVLVVSLKDHHPTVKSAQERVGPFLRTWELDNELQYGANAMRFVYETAEVVDRDPPPPGASGSILAGEGISLSFTEYGAVLSIGLAVYPPPPSTFLASPDVLTLWNRFQGYREGKEPLPAMAYFCLTVLEARGNGRTGAAKLYQVHEGVLRKLGELTSRRGDDTTGRKFLPTRPPLTPQEAGWVEDVVRALVRRVGEHAAGAPLRQINMGDFRSL